MLMNYSRNISKPRVEKKTSGHYYHIKKQFGCAYLSHKEFLSRKDLSVIVIRNGNNHIVGLTLTKKYLETDRKYNTYEKSTFPKIQKPKIGFRQSYQPQQSYYGWGNSGYLGGPYYARQNYGKVKSSPQTGQKRIYIKSMSNWTEKKYHVYQVIFTLVSEKFRGMGYNQILLDYVYNRAVRCKTCTTVIAHIRESNTPSLKSFQKNGYRLSKKWTRAYKNGDKKIRVYRYCSERLNKKVDDDTVEKINKIIKDYQNSLTTKGKLEKFKTKVVEKVKSLV